MLIDISIKYMIDSIKNKHNHHHITQMYYFIKNNQKFILPSICKHFSRCKRSIGRKCSKFIISSRVKINIQLCLGLEALNSEMLLCLLTMLLLQPYGNGKPCTSCGSMMTRGTRSSHWEGGLGCRNKAKMCRYKSCVRVVVIRALEVLIFFSITPFKNVLLFLQK